MKPQVHVCRETRYLIRILVPSRIEPSGARLWWFDDAKGNELGHWVREPFTGGARETIAADLAPAYSAWLAPGTGFTVLGRSRGEEGTTMYVVRDREAPKLIYRHAEAANALRHGFTVDENEADILPRVDVPDQPDDIRLAGKGGNVLEEVKLLLVAFVFEDVFERLRHLLTDDAALSKKEVAALVERAMKEYDENDPSLELYQDE